MSRCWAYNKEGIRCEQEAGHPTLHSMTIAWDDDECFSPIVHQLPEPRPEPVPDMPLESPPSLPEPLPQPAGCVACGHKHAGGECRCGCYEQIG